MGLENLKSVFNDLSKNTLSEKGIHGGLTNEIPSTPPHSDDHSELDDIEKNRATKLDIQTNSTAGKIVFPDNGSVDYSPLVSDKVGPSVGLNTFSQLLDENINKRSFDPSTLGKDQALGLGAYSLETLYNVDHTAVVNRPVIDTGRKDHKGNTIYINTVRAGMGALGNLDIHGYSSHFRTSLLGPEPYIVNEIGSKTNSIGNNRDLIPFTAALEDVSRLAKFYTSPAGVAFMAKENITNQLIGSVPSNDIKPRPLSIQVGGDLNALNKILLPPAPNPIQGNTGFLNFTNQFRDLGSQIASLRKPFLVEYSKRHTLSLPFGFLGDNVPKSFFDGERLIEYPHFKKPRFLGLGQGPKWKNNDKISDSGVEVDTTAVELAELFPDETAFHETLPPLETDIINPIQPGDFYVRIKDLRDGKFIYFRGFVTGIVENVNPSFTPTNYIGRSEPVYQYERAERDLSFNLRVYPANIIQQDKMYEKIEKLTSLAYPEYLQDSDNSSLTRMKAPFTELYMAHIGSRVKGQFGFIKSLSYTVNESGDWDALSALPRLFDIAISYQILNRKPPQMGDKFYRASA